MADLATLKTWLAEAEAALHSLHTGARVVEVSKDGRRVRYQESNKGDLVAYVDDLRIRIAGLETASPRPRRRCIQIGFG